MVEKRADAGKLRSPRYRRWQGHLLHPIDEAFMYFDDKGPVPEALRRLQRLLKQAGIEHLFIGATALQAHGFRRMTEDVDVCLRREDLERFRREFVGRDYQPVEGRSRRFYDPENQVTLDVLIAGATAGDSSRQQRIKFPDPAEAELVANVPVPSLARLIELKLVTWRVKDLADVIELIRRNNLDEKFAEQLDPSVRSVYLQCYDHRVEEDRYNPEVDDPPAES
ncbi:MAG: nucleotidyl transferase AbiEii/AbiGii toxin family protein [Planctomycetota bacterium]